MDLLAPCYAALLLETAVFGSVFDSEAAAAEAVLSGESNSFDHWLVFEELTFRQAMLFAALEAV